MKTVYPDYYKKFRCIAGRCRHTCCAGWEIDIDEISLQKYLAWPGETGDRLRRNIVLDECPHFRLRADESCPFLNSEHLCDLILTAGEDALCDICTDHPRFRNYFCGRMETGLGMCCEAAAALILGHQEKTFLIADTAGEMTEECDPFELAVFSLREEMLLIAQNRNLPFEKRLQMLTDTFGVRIPSKTPAEWAEYYLSLERLDESWTEMLLILRSGISSRRDTCPLLPEIPFEQLLVYFIYRHIARAQQPEEISALLGFCILSCRIILVLYQAGCSLTDEPSSYLAELARLYSSEIEYSEENTDEICSLFLHENDKSGS